MISGYFSGDVEAERLEIVASGEVTGTISTAKLVIESGARFNGTSKIRGQEPPRQLAHDKGGDDKSEQAAAKSKSASKS